MSVFLELMTVMKILFARTLLVLTSVVKNLNKNYFSFL